MHISLGLVLYAKCPTLIILSFLVWFQLKDFNIFYFLLRDVFVNFFKILVWFELVLSYTKFQSSTVFGIGLESNFIVYPCSIIL